MLLCITVALARPTDGGSWAFNETDTVTSYDGPAGLVRVWFSGDGENVTILDDADGSGVPDFVEDVAATAEDVLLNLEATGFQLPLGDGGKGGSDALDAYLVDFAGNADGLWANEACDGGACSGYFTMENDFSGYGYANLHSAVSVLTSHELFHGVQAAYAQSDQVWFLEGTATWAEHLYDPYNNDFIGLCGAYVEDPGRPFYEPPSGPVPAFAYGTALWFYYLGEKYGSDYLVELLDAYILANEQDSLVTAISDLIGERGGTLADDFTTFSRLNLAAGDRSGAMTGEYPFAGKLPEVPIEAQGSSIVAEDRFYPLSTTYYQLDYAGSDELYVGTNASGRGLVLTVFPTDDNGNVLDWVNQRDADAQVHDANAAGAGTYYLSVTNAAFADDSTRLTVCFGDLDSVAACQQPDDTVQDTGASDSGDADSVLSGDNDSAACGCSQGAGGSSAAWGLMAGAAMLSRRRARYESDKSAQERSLR